LGNALGVRGLPTYTARSNKTPTACGESSSSCWTKNGPQLSTGDIYRRVIKRGIYPEQQPNKPCAINPKCPQHSLHTAKTHPTIQDTPVSPRAIQSQPFPRSNISQQLHQPFIAPDFVHSKPLPLRPGLGTLRRFFINSLLTPHARVHHPSRALPRKRERPRHDPPLQRLQQLPRLLWPPLLFPLP